MPKALTLLFGPGSRMMASKPELRPLMLDIPLMLSLSPFMLGAALLLAPLGPATLLLPLPLPPATAPLALPLPPGPMTVLELTKLALLGPTAMPTMLPELELKEPDPPAEPCMVGRPGATIPALEAAAVV